jgi:hypothetical protein
MKKWKYGLLPAVFLVCWSTSGATATVDPNLYLDDVKFLASKELKGRATGSPELEKAGAFIAGKFREFGLKPVDGKSYYQAFQVTTNARLGKANRFHYTESNRNVVLHFPDDFIPFNFSSGGKLAGPVVFVGYGITAPEYNYDDYAGIDVKGKIALMMRHEPQEFDEKSVFAGKSYTRHTQFASKVSNAKNHGAVGVILVNDRANHRSEPDQLEAFGSTEGPAEAGIPFLQVKADLIKSWFADAGKDMDSIAAEIDRSLKSQSFAFPDSLRVDANLDIERAVKTVHNVAGYLPGESDEYVIIGAHYDHLGAVLPGARTEGDRPSRRRRQRVRHRGRHRAGALVLHAAKTEARHSVFNLCGRGIGLVGFHILRRASRHSPGEVRRHDQHGYDRPRAQREALHRRRRNGKHVPRPTGP